MPPDLVTSFQMSLFLNCLRRTSIRRSSPFRSHSQIHRVHSKNLQGKNCLITGGTSGIGYSIAELFAKSGAATIGIVGRDEPRIVDRIKALRSSSSETNFIPVVADVSKGAPDISKHGDFDILVNAAGITHQSLLISTPDEVTRTVIDTNLVGTIITCKTFIKHVTRSRMKKQKDTDANGLRSSPTEACIINISSLLGVKGGRGSSVYAASKAGVIAFSRALALESSLKAGTEAPIRINTITPGYVDTAMTKGNHDRMPGLFVSFHSDIANPSFFPLTAYSEATHSQISQDIPLLRFGVASEIAEAALFLATNPYAHNCVLNLDGGLSAV